MCSDKIVKAFNFQKLSELFKDYAFLWKQDVKVVFREFLAGNIRAALCHAKSEEPVLRSVSEQENHQTSAHAQRDDCSRESSKGGRKSL